jgi:hypothetical protein
MKLIELNLTKVFFMIELIIHRHPVKLLFNPSSQRQDELMSGKFETQ